MLKPTPTFALLLVGLFTLSPVGRATAESETIDLAQYYGFLPPEIFKLEERSGNLLARDINGDGLRDLILVDNSHSRIDVLQQRKSPPQTSLPQPTAGDVNFLPNPWRFEHRKVPVDKQITSLVCDDFNRDGRLDLAYFGVPDRLVVRYQGEDGNWDEQTSFRLPDVPTTQWSVAAGDLNSDGRADIVVLGKSRTYVLLQKSDGALASPVGLMNTSDRLSMAHILDIDGDGKNDLCYVSNDDAERSLCVRHQRADGRLGPELRFPLQQTRAISFASLDGKPGAEVLTVDARTGRIEVRRLQKPDPQPGEFAAQLVQYGFGQQGAGRGRDLAIGDVDGDGLLDVVVTDPEAAQVILFRQHEKEGLDLGTTFPGLDGAEQVRLADLDGDGRAEVIVLSTKEKLLALSEFDGNRLTFPQPLPVQDEPVALEIVDLDGDGKLEVAYITRKRSGRSSSYAFRALRRNPGGDWSADLSFGGQAEAAVELRGAPDRLMQLDANRDGRPDFLVFYGLDRGPQLFVTSPEGVPTELVATGGVGLGEVGAGAVFIGELDQPAVLVAQPSFGRNLTLNEKQQWQVVDQYNAQESSAKIVGITALDLDGATGKEIVLVDSGIGRLRILRREENLYRPWREVEIGNFPYQSSRVADLNGDGRDDLLLFGNNKFGVLYAGRKDAELVEQGTFETQLERTYLGDVIAGDVNGDGRSDLVAVDTRSHYLEIIHRSEEHGLRHALHFRLFEEKNFAAAETGGSEPRESLIADVTGDGRDDLILLVHDRVIVYPQDPGPMETTKDAGEGALDTQP